MEDSVTVSYLQYQQANVITKQENRQTNVNNKYVLNVNFYLNIKVREEEGGCITLPPSL